VDHPDELAFKGVADTEIRFKILNNYPLLAKHRKMVLNQNGIKQWIQVRPLTPF